MTFKPSCPDTQALVGVMEGIDNLQWQPSSKPVVSQLPSPNF